MEQESLDIHDQMQRCAGVHTIAGEGLGKVRVSAHWLRSGVNRESLNGSEVLVNHGGLRRLSAI